MSQHTGYIQAISVLRRYLRVARKRIKTPSPKTPVFQILSIFFAFLFFFFFLFFILVLVFQDMVPRDRMDECVCAYVCAHVYMYVQKYTFVQLVLSLHLYMGSRD